MALVAKMVNPTPFDVKIPYQKGIYIKVPADGDTELSMSQLDDFRPGKPGSEGPKKLLDFEGVFLEDSDLSYDFQALQALNIAVQERETRIKDFIERTKNARIAGGATVDDATMDDLLTASGYSNMQSVVDKLKARIGVLSQVVNEDAHKGAVKQTLDPKRTCFVINPPRQFPSETALRMFLLENPEIAAAHNKFVEAAAGDEGTEEAGPPRAFEPVLNGEFNG
ncbi:hypothetical protein LCGC14_2074850 [marine sediment metagenome]|uniref:Uncharacterized protein n=1 Tax=marine sediment metagenome TaxID=412755 RepID=A0A0F9GVM7_9ZZZZ